MEPEELARIPEAVGTPCFLYDADAIQEQQARLSEAFGQELEVFYSYKTNTAVGRFVSELGCGLQVTSLEHAREALRFAAPEKLIFNSRILDRDDARFLLDNGIHVIANSMEQIRTVQAVDKDASFGIRVDTGIAPRSAGFPANGVGLGIPKGELERIEAPIEGIHNHLASQNEDAQAYAENAEQVLLLAKRLDARYIDIGGGFPIPYDAPVPPICEFARAYRGWGRRLLAEPGRILVGPAGILVATVKEVANGMATIDASVFTCARDRVLSGFKLRLPTFEKGDRTYRIKGSTPCSLDDFGEYALPELRKGDRVVFRQAGAYCFTTDGFAGARIPRQYIVRDRMLQGPL